MADILIDHSDLRAFIRDVFVAAGFRREEAESEAEVLVWADLRGLGSHGVFRVPMYISWMRQGRRNPDSHPTVVGEKGASRVIDADQAPACS